MFSGTAITNHPRLNVKIRLMSEKLQCAFNMMNETADNMHKSVKA